MRKTFTLLAAIVSIAAHAQNPFAEYGYQPRVATLSQGQFNEFHDQDSIVQIGSVLFNTNTNEIVAFVEYDTIHSEATLEPDVVSRWLSPDPLAAKYPSHSPYNFVLNNPIIYIDPDGRDVELIIGQGYVDEHGKEHPYGHVSLRVFDEAAGYDVIYDFGRYGATAGGIFGVLPDGSNPKGDGILRVHNDGDVYIDQQQAFRSSVGYMMQTTRDQDQQIMDHFSALTSAGERQKDKETSGMSQYKLEFDYWIKGPNCSTVSQDGLDQINVNFIGDEYDPREAGVLMETRYKELGMKRTEYHKGGTETVTTDPYQDATPIQVAPGTFFSPY